MKLKDILKRVLNNAEYVYLDSDSDLPPLTLDGRFTARELRALASFVDFTPKFSGRLSESVLEEAEKRAIENIRAKAAQLGFSDRQIGLLAEQGAYIDPPEPGQLFND